MCMLGHIDACCDSDRLHPGQKPFAKQLTAWQSFKKPIKLGDSWFSTKSIELERYFKKLCVYSASIWVHSKYDRHSDSAAPAV